MMAAVPLIVHDVETLVERDAAKRISASARVSRATPTRPTSSVTSGSSES